ncbi:hypothetical protein [Nodularia sp. NIES-3585]|uniref:hypothetical protein n=1 Tax=Nodularia sp. NIES-3585 TaxID=1973477 RepID=UPI000B5CD583|nr:hypothetical protein [Nodularia sp. NIES-3585]GAX34882.1 hypothetical protein NIES3585_08870 [Nodularia sp. NIES-3585]
MIRRSLLTAALIVAGSVAVAPKAMAQSVDVPFTGSVGGVCNVGQVTPGVLVADGPTPGNPTALFADSPMGGSRGKVAVSCNQQAEVSVSSPQQTGGPSFIPIWSNSSVESPYGWSNADHNGAISSHQIPSGMGIELLVSMHVDKGVALVPGVYSYVTTVSITPF